MPLKTRTGVRRPMGLFLKCSQTLRPSSLGKTTSSRTRSGITSANLSSASVPSLHTIATCPASLTTNSSILAIQGSSSTTRILRRDAIVPIVAWPRDQIQSLQKNTKASASRSRAGWRGYAATHVALELEVFRCALRRWLCDGLEISSRNKPFVGDQVSDGSAKCADKPAIVDQWGKLRNAQPGPGEKTADRSRDNGADVPSPAIGIGAFRQIE